MENHNRQVLDPAQQEFALMGLKKRFEANMERHPGLHWADVQKKLEAEPHKLWSLNEMEKTGGEPDVTGYEQSTNTFLFVDCSWETPAGRRSICYDRDALESRKANKPAGSAVGMAGDMGIDLLTEVQYRQLQALGAFDTKTSSWILTPDTIRRQGGGLFCDRRYGAVFVYHNGAESYYASRGFRGCLRV